MVQFLAPRSARLGAEVLPANVRAVEVSVPHIAAGLWLGTVAVLMLPSFSRHEHRVTEDHILRAYGVVMSAFPLL